MASPFAVFRRNQKIMLATVGIGAMIAFVFLDPVMRYMGGQRAPENPVVVETRYGALKESDLASIRAGRELVEVFLHRVTMETVQQQVKNGVMDERMADRMFERRFSVFRDMLMGRSTNAPEEAAVETYVLSRKAQQLGIIVSDRAINDFLKQLSDDSLTGEMLQGVVNSLQTGNARRISTARLFDGIRTEMLASKISEIFAQSLRDVPPAQKFEYFCRLNQRAKVELVPLAVADFIGQVPDPSDDELKSFFDKYKDRFADPASPEPGFKEPRRAAFQYFKADFAKFKEKAAPEVTDAEIAEYYEKNKEQFRAIELSDDKKPDADESDAEATEQTDKPAGQPEQPAGDDKSETKPEAAKQGEKATEEQPADKSSDKPDQSLRARRSPFHLVSTAADEPAAGETPKPTDDAKPAEPATSDQPGEEKPADEKPADDKAEDQEAEAKPAPPKYEPLEKVRDQIRESLAGQKASKEIGEIFDELSADMKRYADDLDVYNARKGSDTRLTLPKPLDFAALAAKKGVVAKELPLSTASEAAGEDIGQVRKIIQDRRSQFGFRAEPFAQFAFLESFPTYKPDMAQDNTAGDVYLFWKTEEKPAYVPALDQVREKVVRAWKLIKARDIAHKRADEYAAQARAANKPLKEALANQPDLKVTESDWFSWMTLGNVPFDPAGGQPRLSEVEGVTHPGAAFMKDVFQLDAGAVGVATNEPQDTMYVVRLAEYEKSLEDLRTDFAGQRQPIYMALARPDQRRIYDHWLADVEKDARVKWIRPANNAQLRDASDFQGDVEF